MRDDFPVTAKELLAKRVAYRCSNPGCRQVTSGPQEDPTKVINVGVAAHITAASADGPRYDVSLTPDERRSAENGIWLCQKCAKLVDNDPVRYTTRVLHGWKRSTEAAAARELEQSVVPEAKLGEIFEKLEGMMPDLLAEMRKDLADHPVSREFVILKKSWSYWGKGQELVYYYEDHPQLDSKLRVLQNHGLIRDMTYTNVARYIITEELASYLGGL